MGFIFWPEGLKQREGGERLWAGAEFMLLDVLSDLGHSRLAHSYLVPDISTPLTLPKVGALD